MLQSVALSKRDNTNIGFWSNSVVSQACTVSVRLAARETLFCLVILQIQLWNN